MRVHALTQLLADVYTAHGISDGILIWGHIMYVTFLKKRMICMQYDKRINCTHITSATVHPHIICNDKDDWRMHIRMRISPFSHIMTRMIDMYTSQCGLCAFIRRLN